MCTMASMEQFLVALTGFSERLEVRRVEMKQRFAEFVDRHIDDLQKKVRAVDGHCRRRIRTQQRRSIKKEEDGEEEMIPVIKKKKKRTKKVTSEGIDAAGPSRDETLKSSSVRKRKQSNGHAKKKVRIEDSSDDDGDESNDGNENLQIKVKHIVCSQANCNIKLKSMKLYHEHRKDVHGLQKFRCLLKDCGNSFENRNLLGKHLKAQHRNVTEWSSGKCPNQLKNYAQLFDHVYRCHLKGRFQCIDHAGCQFTASTRGQIRNHQKQMHCIKSHVCPVDGCGAMFFYPYQLMQHERTHANVKPFACVWPDCNYAANKSDNVVQHVRTRHFKLPPTIKQQRERGIVDDRDPKDYVRENIQQAADDRLRE